MIKNMPYPVIAAVLACCFLISCRKPDDVEDLTNREPPKVETINFYPVVGSNIDSFELKSAPVYNYQPGELPYAPAWETEWTCTSKPAGAADPLILQKNAQTAYATNLASGNYRFEVTYRTKVGASKAYFDVTVVQAKPSGTVIVSERVDWKLLEDDLVSAYPAGFWAPEPTIFYYSGISKLPVVEYQDPVNGQWKKVAVYAYPEYRNNLTLPPQSQNNGRADIYFYNNKMNLSILWGLTPDFLQAIIAKPPAVRLTYP